MIHLISDLLTPKTTFSWPYHAFIRCMTFQAFILMVATASRFWFDIMVKTFLGNMRRACLSWYRLLQTSAFPSGCRVGTESEQIWCTHQRISTLRFDWNFPSYKSLVMRTLYRGSHISIELILPEQYVRTKCLSIGVGCLFLPLSWMTTFDRLLSWVWDETQFGMNHDVTD